VASLVASSPALAADFVPAQQTEVQSISFAEAAPLATAPDVKADGSQLPEGAQWRYSEFLGAVENGKVERVRFSKDGSVLQLTAVDGRRATVVLPNDPDLVDILAKNGVDISVSEGDQQGNYVSLLGNILFPLIAFGGLFFLFRRGQNGSSGGGGPMGGMGGGMGGPMDFGRSKSKFQEVPETGVTFADVAVRGPSRRGRAAPGGARMPRGRSPACALCLCLRPACSPAWPGADARLPLGTSPPPPRAATAPSWSWSRWWTS
jgi:cell division protease FtsH